MVELVFLGFNDVGKRIYEWLVDREDVSVLALLTDEEQLDIIPQLDPDLLISAGFRNIVPADILDVPELGAINLHKSYLPYNRGANPNVWSILEDHPAGVSIHYMTPDIDEGPILDRREVPVRPDDTARDLYDRLEECQFEQFKDVWPRIRDGDADVIEQDSDEGSYHYKREFVDLWELDLEERTTVGEFLDRLRALTFPPYRNAYFDRGGTRYYVDVRIREESEPVDEVERNLPTYSAESADDS